MQNAQRLTRTTKYVIPIYGILGIYNLQGVFIMKKQLSLAIALASLAGLNVGFAASVIPVTCPSAIAIKVLGVSSNVVQVNNAWFAGRRNELYGTTNRWSFAITNIIASDASDAFIKASRAIESLTFQAGPIPGPLNKVVCAYNTAQGYAAYAVSPPVALSEILS